MPHVFVIATTVRLIKSSTAVNHCSRSCDFYARGAYSVVDNSLCNDVIQRHPMKIIV